MSFIWGRTSVATAAIALVASWYFIGPVEQSHGQAITAAETQVVCITDWTNANDFLSWKFRLRKGGAFRLKITYAVHPDAADGQTAYVANTTSGTVTRGSRAA